MKRSIINPGKFEKLANNSLTYTQLLMIKGGGNNPPSPEGGTTTPPDEPVPTPNDPNGQ